MMNDELQFFIVTCTYGDNEPTDEMMSVHPPHHLLLRQQWHVQRERVGGIDQSNGLVSTSTATAPAPLIQTW